MARRRGRQKGRLVKGNVSWYGYWWAWETNPRTGEVGWRQKSKAICPTVMVDAQKKKTKVTRTQAQELFNEQVLDLLETVVPTQTEATVRQFWTLHFEPSIKLRLRRRGIMHYQGLFGTHILPTKVGPAKVPFGDLSLRAVDYSLVQDLIYRRKEAGYSAQTLLHIRHALTSLFKLAKRLRWYSGDLPTEGVEVGRIEKRRATNAVDWQQARGVIELLPEPYRTMVVTMVLTGIRVGEATGLQWKHLNLGTEWTTLDGKALRPHTMAVRQTYSLAKDPQTGEWSWEYGPTKSTNGTRDIPLPQIVVGQLKTWKENTKHPGPDDPVFPNGIGKPVDYNNAAARVLKPIGVKLGMLNGVDKKGQPKSWLSWHCFRRTANTLAGAEGMTVGERMRVFGWADDSMVGVYDRTDAEAARGVLDRMAERLLPGGGMVQ